MNPPITIQPGAIIRYVTVSVTLMSIKGEEDALIRVMSKKRRHISQNTVTIVEAVF